MSQGLPPRRLGFIVPNENTPLAVRPRRRVVRGITVDNVTVVTRGPAAVPVRLRRRQQFDLLRSLVSRSPRPERTYITLEFRGEGRLLYRTLPSSVFTTRNPQAGFDRFQRRLNVFESLGLVSGTGLDDDGVPLTFDGNAFSILYGVPEAVPPRFVGNDALGWGAEAERVVPGLLPYAHSYNESPSGVHCADHVCFWLGVPLYSRRSDRPNPDELDLAPPTWDMLKEYLERELANIYPEGHPGRILYAIKPYEMQARTLTLRENLEHMKDLTFAEVSPAQMTYFHGHFYQALSASMILQIRDPEHLLAQSGPAVVMVGKEHVEFVPMFWSRETGIWVPMVRKQPLGPLFLSRDMKLFALGRKKRQARALAQLTDAENWEAGFKDWPAQCHGHRKLWEFDELMTGEDSADPQAKMRTFATFDKRHLYMYEVLTAAKVRTLALGNKVLNVYWDGESVYSVGTGQLKLYSLCALFLSNEEAKQAMMERHESEFVPRMLEKTKAYYGWDCVEDFIRDLARAMASEQYSEIRIKTFNGSGFDNFFFSKTLEDLNLLEDSGRDEMWYNQPVFASIIVDEKELFLRTPRFQNQFFQGSRLLGATIGLRFSDGSLCGTKAVFCDIAKHMPGMSLNECGKSFQTKSRKKEGFSHEKVQVMYEQNPENFWDDPELHEELTVYNKLDCIVLFEVEQEYLTAMHRLCPRVFSLTERMPMTIGSGVRKHWVLDWTQRAPGLLDFTDDDKARLTVYDSWEPLNETQWKALRTGIPGGWVNLPTGPQRVREPVSSFDVKGLYSFIMVMWNAAMYPVGTARRLKPMEAPRADKYGAFHIDVDMTPMLNAGLVPVLPQKIFSPSGALLRNNWNAAVVNSTWVTTPILRVLQRFQCPITYRGGVEYSHAVRGYDLFQCLVPFLAEKKKQDRLKGTPEFNAALRMVSKLFMNTLYGQMLIGLFERTIMRVDDKSLARLYENSSVKSINVISVINSSVFADVTRTTESRLGKQGPFIVGAHVLGWSQVYMFEKLFSRVPRQLLFYKDTDAGKIPKRIAESLVREYAHETMDQLVWPDLVEVFPEIRGTKLYGGDEGGCFEEELPPNSGAIFVAKKTYVVVAENEVDVAMEGPGHPAMGAKGVRRTDIVLTDEDVRQIREASKGDQEVYTKMCRDLFTIRPTVVDVGVELFDRIRLTGSAYLMTSSLARVTSNPRRGVTADDSSRFQSEMLHVLQRFMIKKISCTAHSGVREGERAVVGQPYQGMVEEAEAIHQQVRAYDIRIDNLDMDDRNMTVDNDEHEVEIQHLDL